MRIDCINNDNGIENDKENKLLLMSFWKDFLLFMICRFCQERNVAVATMMKEQRQRQKVSP
jgi:hypothetical protein